MAAHTFSCAVTSPSCSAAVVATAGTLLLTSKGRCDASVVGAIIAAGGGVRPTKQEADNC